MNGICKILIEVLKKTKMPIIYSESEQQFGNITAFDLYGIL